MPTRKYLRAVSKHRHANSGWGDWESMGRLSKSHRRRVLTDADRVASDVRRLIDERRLRADLLGILDD